MPVIKRLRLGNYRAISQQTGLLSEACAVCFADLAGLADSHQLLWNVEWRRAFAFLSGLVAELEQLADTSPLMPSRLRR